jgi:hypothetical protein
MIKKVTMMIALFIGLIGQADAQVWVSDSVVLGQGTQKDVFYNMASGKVKEETNQNWIFALGTKMQTAGVFVNHNNGSIVYNIHKDSSQWNTVTYLDTVTAAKPINPDTSWTVGAMNVNKGANPFDFGWGKYNLTSHEVYGDSIFIVGQGTNFYKMMIVKMTGTNDYTVKIGTLSGPALNFNIPFNKAPKYNNSNLIYISAGMAGLKDTNREPTTAWDLNFCKYLAWQNNAPYYPSVGALSNDGVQTAKVVAVNIDNVTTADANYTNTKINNIGFDWKYLVSQQPVVYDITDSATQSYVVKSKDGMQYQLAFTGYTGSGTGIIRFNKRALAVPAAISDINSNIIAIGLTPNPTTTNVLVTLEAKTTEAALVSILGLNGAVISTQKIQMNSGVNAISLPLQQLASGTYFVNIKTVTTNITKPIVRQ